LLGRSNSSHDRSREAMGHRALPRISSSSKNRAKEE
jgi:hypothetical protein